MVTYVISDDSNYSAASTISSALFGANFVTHAETEFVPDSTANSVLSSLGVTSFRYPGGGVTEGVFTEAVFATGNWEASQFEGRSLTPMSVFFETANEIGANVTLVIPTRVAFETSAAQAIFNYGNDSGGEHYGNREIIDSSYEARLVAYIDEAIRLSTQNGVEITSLEIGNEYWGSGQMTAGEYGFIAAYLSEFLNGEYPSKDILVQATSSQGWLSPKDESPVYLEPLPEPGGGYGYNVHKPADFNDNLPSGWLEIRIPGQGNSLRQTETIAEEIADNPTAIAAVDGMVLHNYFGDGFSGIDTENNHSFKNVFGEFTTTLGRTDIDYHATEWSPRGNNADGLQYGQSFIEAFFELVSNGVDAADVWPLTFANVGTLGRTLIDTRLNEVDLTFGGVAFSWLSETTVGKEVLFDFEVSDEIDIHGFGNDSHRILFVGERSGQDRTNVVVDLDSFALSGDYFLTITALSETGSTGTSNREDPVVSYVDGSMETGDTVAFNTEDWGLVRIEMTASNSGANLLEGREADDSIHARGGNDTVYGNGGDDTIRGGSGNDSIYGGNGNDDLRAWNGNDRIYGGEGDDYLEGADGSDTLVGGNGNDELRGGSSTSDIRDNIFGGEGTDTIYGGYGNDELRGDNGDDLINGENGADILIGGDGNDTIAGGGSADDAHGGNGSDFINGGWGFDLINGGSGADRFYHLGISDHGSDWIQDYSASEGDVLLFGISTAAQDQFQVNFAHSADAAGERSGYDNVEEAFVIYQPTGQIMWALVDGGGQASINLRIGGDVFDLLA
ncbi:calcium-binding protein [Shimia thalassica]|uniref:calcium-binding protein n=1 Tax=Shimia thalassica TaxID=1715693 RepID=UPI0026E30E3A|nr:calcium-binding protein [Shimia thalassica]MDO6799726.1 calcium-binding protein [Shimia thalassica]